MFARMFEKRSFYIVEDVDVTISHMLHIWQIYLHVAQSLRSCIFEAISIYKTIQVKIVQAVHGNGPFPVVSRVITPLIGSCNTRYQYTRPFIRVYNITPVTTDRGGGTHSSYTWRIISFSGS